MDKMTITNVVKFIRMDIFNLKNALLKSLNEINYIIFYREELINTFIWVFLMMMIEKEFWTSIIKTLSLKILAKTRSQIKRKASQHPT